MTQLFLKLLNMSISASWLVLAVMVLRLLFKKAPKWISCLLWSIVALRLVMPLSFESALSLLPSAEVIPQNIAVTQTPAIYSGISAVNNTVNPLFTQYLTPEDHTLEAVLFLVSAVWLAGVTALLLYSAFSYWRLHRQVRASIRIQKGLYVCDDVESPFILGSLFPRIYIPSGMDNVRLQYVLAHENAHLKRLDHWWKPLGFMLLTVYWFNPLLWLAYILLCRDIERACDEKVITAMDNTGKKAYSEALVACSVHRRMIMACPVAFGEVGVKDRIKGIIRYKKPSFWIIVTAAIACMATAVCFLTNPTSCAHTYSSEIAVCSTCTEKGIQTLTCQLCDHSYTTRADLLAHTYAQGDVLTAPDCVHLGSKELICTGCGAAKTEVMEKTAHTPGEAFLSKAPNCVETGEMSAECTTCHAVQVVATVEPNHDHDLQETVLQETSCAAPGEGIITCTRCDYAEGCTYEQLEHNFVLGATYRGTCISDGYEKYVCTGCDAEFSLSLPNTTEHSWYSPGNGPTRCTYCNTIKPGTGEAWGYGSGSLNTYNPPWYEQYQQMPVINIDDPFA